ncbi:MAG: single-stranded DNA-binding protein [Desulfobacteraceae bacterium]|nr:MAG: single-stranded DNA-binding protein [Desulfobacteraceae bacterium]
MEQIEQIIDTLVQKVSRLRFGPPVRCVYNPLTYARSAHLAYWRRYGRPPKEILFLGMNPGPWGMVQTGVPFGDVGIVTQWLGIHVPLNVPEQVHPKRLVQGFACSRGEISGQRLWGWARQRFKTPLRFFERFWVANYCPLSFMEDGGRNRTPDKLPQHEKEPLLAACDEALVQTVQLLDPQYVVGVGKFAAQQAQRALAGTGLPIGQITHPSPANPKANAGWSELIEQELQALGIRLELD